MTRQGEDREYGIRRTHLKRVAEGVNPGFHVVGMRANVEYVNLSTGGTITVVGECL